MFASPDVGSSLDNLHATDEKLLGIIYAPTPTTAQDCEHVLHAAWVECTGSHLGHAETTMIR